MTDIYINELCIKLGLPDRNKYHVTEVATFALKLVELIGNRQFIVNGDRLVQVRIGINTGNSQTLVYEDFLLTFEGIE